MEMNVTMKRAKLLLLNMGKLSNSSFPMLTIYTHPTQMNVPAADSIHKFQNLGLHQTESNRTRS